MARLSIAVLAVGLAVACSSTPKTTESRGDEWTIGVMDVADGWTRPGIDVADTRTPRRGDLVDFEKTELDSLVPADVTSDIQDISGDEADGPDSQVDVPTEVEEVKTPPPHPPFIAQIPCLDYDGVLADYEDPYVVTPDMYAHNMKWLSENGYTAMTLRRLLELLEDPAFPGDDFPPRPVLVFSDTTGSWFYDTAAPILDEYEYRATVAVEGDLMGQDWAMTGEQIADLEARGYELASHTISHPDLTQIDDEQLTAEVAGSKALFEEMGLNITTFVYPFGYYDDRVIEAVQEAGYVTARAAVDITGGGYSTFDLARRWEFGCAVVLAKTTKQEIIDYVSNPKLELEDLFLVVEDAGELSAIFRTSFEQDSYGAVYMADAGDSVVFRVHVTKPGIYNLSFRVKTGIEGDPLSTADGYLYTLNGDPLSFQQEGPTAVEQEYIVWGFHRFEPVELTAGMAEFQVTCLQDWAVLLDYMTLELIQPD